MANEAQLLTNLRKKRGAIKRKVTEFSNFVDTFNNQTLTRVQQVELRSRMEGLSTILERLDEVQNQIFELTISEQTDEQNASLIEATYYTVIAKAKTLLEVSGGGNDNQAIDDAASQHSDTSQSSRNSSNGNTVNHIRLPTISLPKFDGKFTKWLEFHDTFDSLIHTNESLSDIQRFHYLKASLIGEASEIIKSLQLSASNYTIAWKLVCDRYTNKKLLVQNHLRELFAFNDCTKESASQLRDMLDTTTRHLHSLEALGQPVEQWDAIIIYLVSSKFDKVTARDWELFKSAEELPSWNELKAFLNSKADMLDNLQLHDFKPSRSAQRVQKAYVSANMSCYFCKEPHGIYSCPKFLALSVDERLSNVKRLKLCTNCLRNSHTADKCESTSSKCKKCKRNHNTLLHFERPAPATSTTIVENPIANASNELSLSSRVTAVQVLLATAVVEVVDTHGRSHKCRALLDSASQSSFMTSALQKRLGLPLSPSNTSVQGINQVVSQIQHQSSVTIFSLVKRFNFTVKCLVIDKISDSLPSVKIDSRLLHIPDDLELADPQFLTPDQVDILIGAEVFWSLLIPGQIQLGKHLPVIQNSQLGWIVSGPIKATTVQSSHCYFVGSISVQDQLQKFWELEECPSSKFLSQEEELCEATFRETVQRDETGKFVVSIPLKDSPSKLGESKSTAEKRLFSLERKLQANTQLKQEYIKFMHDYESLGHMSKITDLHNDQPQYFLPHHVVVNQSSKTTTHRVVFDASCPTSSGLSLNDIQLVGPNIQSDLFSILVRFRQHQIVFSADVQKMYRQVLVNPKDRSLQRIVWRTDPSLPIDTYELNTVTYGTASAPFLATRCLVEIANEHQQQFPHASYIIRSDFYVDDILSGGSNVDEVKKLCENISHILSTIHFKLHKWVTNEPTILPPEVPTSQAEVQIGSQEMTKTLGLYWSPCSDTLHFKIAPVEDEQLLITKRRMLSQISQVFDPLGLLSACIVVCKVLLQGLWQQQLDWDEPIPKSMTEKWRTFRNDLLSLNDLQIPRHIGFSHDVEVQIHCFSDASELAYAACIYIRISNKQNQVQTSLLCAKSKVAPLKKLTIPRLELCAAHLSVNLLAVVKDSLRLPIQGVFLWSDSTIVLGWIKTSPHLLKVFVSHRVADIQSKCSDATWNYVPTRDNPADLGSRGVFPSQLKDNPLWWHGPLWLKSDPSNWPKSPVSNDCHELPEMKRVEVSFLGVPDDFVVDVKRFSNFSRLVRSISYCFRFKAICLTPSQHRMKEPLTVDEVQRGLMTLIKAVQREVWAHEISLLKAKQPIPNKSKLLCLNPFLDSNGICRVGGRLEASQLPYPEKHQILLPKHYVTMPFDNQRP